MIVNGALNIIMKRLSRFERHHSIEAREVSFGRRLFLVLWINTAIVSLIVNARLQGLEGLQGTTFHDFVSDWYAAAAAAAPAPAFFAAASQLTRLLPPVEPQVRSGGQPLAAHHVCKHHLAPHGTHHEVPEIQVRPLV